MARQAALLLLTVHGYEIPLHAVNDDFYRQALELRIPRGHAETVYSAMGGIGKRRFSQFKDLLRLSDEAMELADRHHLDEGVLRYVTDLNKSDQVEMIQQIIQFGLSVKQVKAIIDQGDQGETEDEVKQEIPIQSRRLAKMLVKNLDQQDAGSLWRAVCQEENDPHMARAYLLRLAQLANNAAANFVEEN